MLRHLVRAVTAGALLAAPLAAQSTTRAVLGLRGADPDVGDTYEPSISGDGRYVCFQSEADNLVPNDTNGWMDCFRLDRLTGQITLVSKNFAGGQVSFDSYFASMASDGVGCVYRSPAINIVPDDTNGVSDCFYVDFITDRTQRVSLGDQGQQADGDCKHATVSANGRWIAFRSSATNLVPNDTNGVDDIFVRDRTLSTTVRVSVGTRGEQSDGASEHCFISADGQFVAFRSHAGSFDPADTNGVEDIYLHDMNANTTTLISKNTNGVVGDGESTYPAVSENGRYVCFMSDATNLVPQDSNGHTDIFHVDRLNGTIRLISSAWNGGQADGDSYFCSISRDGRFVGFVSDATNLVPHDTNGLADTFVVDTLENTTERVSVSELGDAGQADSFRPTLSADGRYSAFASHAPNFGSMDGNGHEDVMVHDRLGPFAVMPAALGGALGAPQLSGSGHPVAGSDFGLSVSSGLPLSLCFLDTGLSIIDKPFKGGVFVPSPDMLAVLVLSLTGGAKLNTTWPDGVPEGTRFYAQAWIMDLTGPLHWTATDAIWCIAP